MSKFNELMKQDHVRNHPMFQGFDDRLKAARERLSRKAAAPDLRDIFSSQKAVGLGTNDRSVRAYIQEAAVSARSVLDMCEFPMLPQISFNNVKRVRMAAHDDSQVVDAEIFFNVRIMTKSGAIRQALIPVVVSRGVVVPPSTLIYDQQMKVIAQSTIDEIVQRNTSYQLPPMRRMYDPPLRGEELDRAASERNTLGWMPREVVTDGMGIRHSRRAQMETGTYEVLVGNLGTVYTGPDEQEALADFKEYVEQSQAGYGRASGESVTLLLDGEIVQEHMGTMDNEPGMGDTGLGSGPEVQVHRTDDGGNPYHNKNSRRQAAFETYARSLVGQDKTNPGTPSSLANPPAADATQSDATQLSNPATDPTMAGVPGGEKTPYGQYAESGNSTDSLYRQILAQPDIMQQVQQVLSPSRETLTDGIVQMVSPMMAVLGLRTDDVNWDYLLDELTAGLSGVTASKIGKAEVRKVALVIAEYVTGRRRFGRRRAAADTASAITEMTTYLQSAQDTFKPDELAYYQQIAQEAQSALQGGDEQTAKDLLVELENAFSFTDVPQEQEVPTDYWNTFTATCKKLAQQTNLVKEMEVDEDDNKPMKRYMPAGYDLVLEDMVKAEEDGLDTFPRPYSHIERNYILRRYPTCSRDKWLPHLINDGFALNPYGKGPNRGRPVREASKEARGQGGGAEDLTNWLGGLFIMKGCVSTSEDVELRNYQGESEPVYVAIVHDSSGFNPSAALATSQRSQDEALQEAWEILETNIKEGLSREELDEAWKTEEAEGYDPITDGWDGAVFTMSPQEFKQVVDTLQGVNADELRVIDFIDNFEEEEPEEGFGEEPEAPIEPKLSRSAQMDDEGGEESWEPNVRAKKDLRTSDGDRIKAGTGGFLMWARGDVIEVLVPPSIQDSFKREDWEDIGPAQAGPVASRSAQVGMNDYYPNFKELVKDLVEEDGHSVDEALKLAIESFFEWNEDDSLGLSDSDIAGFATNVQNEIESGTFEVEQMETPTIYLDNLDHDDGMVMVHISGPGAAAWAKNDQSIQGSMWESDGSDFAYAIISDSPTLVEELTEDGYNVDDSEYSAPTLEELQALDPMNG